MKNMLILAMVAAASAAGAATWDVADEVSLTNAIAKAAANDTIRLAAGTYELSSVKSDASNCLNLPSKALVFEGADATSWRDNNGRTKAILMGDGTTRVILAQSHITLRHITVQGGNADGGAGLRDDNQYANVILTNCVFVNNHSTSTLGALRRMKNNDNPVRDCLFENNSCESTAYGQGVANYGIYADCVFLKNSSKGTAAVATTSTYTDCDFVSNTCTYAAGGTGSTATRCRFIGNTATYGAALSGSTATDCVFVGNVSQWGGALASCNATGCVFSNNVATVNHDNGGGAMFASSTDTAVHLVKNCTFVGNFSAYHGGAIFGQHGVTNCTFVGNGTTGNGGAIINCASNLSGYGQKGAVVGCTFIGNSATNAVAGSSKGGALYNVNLYDCTIVSNRSSYVGGGLANCASVDSCRILDNTSVGIGAGVYDDAGTMTIRNSLIAGNRTSSYGGGLCNAVNVIDCVISNNVAGTLGGGYYANYGGRKVVGCTFIGNQVTNANAQGGGLAYYNTALGNLVSNCTFRANRSSGSSAGVHNATNVVESFFADNTNAYFSGHAWYSKFAHCRFTGVGQVTQSICDRCEFFGFRPYGSDISFPFLASRNSAGAYVSEARNCLFHDNDYADALACNMGSSMTVRNCTFANNTNLVSVMSIQKYGDTYVPTTVFENNLCTRNFSKQGADFGLRINAVALSASDGSELSLRNNLAATADVPADLKVMQSGNILGDPRVFRPGNRDKAPAWMPRKSSPAVNHGLTYDWSAAALDFAGTNRMFNGGVDIGCYEATVDSQFGLTLIVK